MVMEWKRVKSMLIILFLIVDIFLIYQICMKNKTTSADTLNALNSILETRNISLKIDIDDITHQTKMQKLLIISDEGINKDVKIKLDEVSKEAEYIGNRRKIVDLAILVATFIRDNKAENLTISDIYLCYYYDSTQVNENVKYAEAEPSWVIELENGEKYIYSAYTGNFSKFLR
jgi:hypothetical protein